MKRQAILRIFGLLAVTWAIVAAVPLFGQPPGVIASSCTCGPGTFKCTYDDGSCTCLALGDRCKESETEMQ